MYNGWIFLTLDDDGKVVCNSSKVVTAEDKRDNRECPEYYEISSDFENETRRMNLIIDNFFADMYTLLGTTNGNVIITGDDYSIAVEPGDEVTDYGERMHTYQGSGKDKFYPVEVVLNATPNHTTEEVLSTKVVTTEEEVQQLYAGTFPIEIDCNGANLAVSDFVVFVRFLHAAYYTRIDRGYFEVTRKSGNPNMLYVKLDNTVLASINSEIVVTTVDVERTMTFSTEADSDKPYYYLPLIRYDKVGNAQSFYLSDVAKFDVIIDGFTLVPNKDYSLVNCGLHAEMPSMIVFEQGIKPGAKVELNFLDDDVYSTLMFPNKNNAEIIEIRDNENLFVSNTFVIYVNGKKLNASQYEIVDRKHLRILLDNRKSVVVKFQYKQYNNMKKILNLLHTSSEFMSQSEAYKLPNEMRFTTEYYEGVDDSEGYGKAYQILGYADQAFNNEEDVVYDCNKEISNIIDTPINTGVFYDLDYFNNDLFIDCNVGYNKFDHTLFVPECEMPEPTPIVDEPIYLTGNFKVSTTKGDNPQRILELEFDDKYNDEFDYELYVYVNNSPVLLTHEYGVAYRIGAGRYRVCNDMIYHDITDFDTKSGLTYMIVKVRDDGSTQVLDKRTYNIG